MAEIAPDRDLWWGVLMALAVLLSLSVPLQALATMLLVRARGSGWATIGGVLMWVGAVVHAAGLAGWAAAYFFPTDPAVGAAAGRTVVEAANADEAHLVALVPIGMGLVVVGTLLQCVGLFRARVVPTWLPVAALFVTLTFVVPGYGAASLIASLPMAAAALGFAYYAVRNLAQIDRACGATNRVKVAATSTTALDDVVLPDPEGRVRNEGWQDTH